MSKREIKVFISSTFSDMHSERNCLVRRVFPRLQAHFADKNVAVTGIDLRWGITQEQCDNDEALSYCLEQVAACDILLCMLGERYGYIPQEDEAGSMHLSITEREILCGIDKGSAVRKTICFLREQDAVHGYPPEFGHLLIDKSPRSEKLYSLKQQICRDFPNTSVYYYAARYSGLHIPWRLLRQICSSEELSLLTNAIANGTPKYEVFSQLPEYLQSLLKTYAMPVFDGMGSFEEKVFEALADAVLSFIGTQGEETDFYTRETLFHDSQLEKLVTRRIERPELDGLVQSFIHRDDDRLLLINGEEGVGVSTELAYAACYAQGCGFSVFYYSTNVTDRSADINVFLQLLNNKLSEISNLALSTPQSDLSALLAEMLRQFGAIEKIGDERRLCVVVDGVELLQDSEKAAGLLWIPLQIPSAVKLVIGSNSTSFAGHNILRWVEQRTATVITVKQFKKEELSSFLDYYPALTAKSLSHEQKQLLVDNVYCRRPLFISIVLEQLQLFGVFNLITGKIKALPVTEDVETLVETTMRPVLCSLLKEFFAELGEEFGEREVAVMVAGLSHVGYGVSMQVLRVVLSKFELNQDAAPGFVRIMFPFLNQFGGRLRYSYFIFKEVAESLFDTPDDYRTTLAIFGQYLQADVNRQIKTAGAPVNSSQLADILDLYVVANQSDAVYALLTKEPTCALIHGHYNWITSRAWVFLNRDGRYSPQKTYPELSKSYSPDSAEYNGFCHVLLENCRNQEALALLEKRVHQFESRAEYCKEHAEALEIMGRIAGETYGFSQGFRFLVAGEYLARRARDMSTAARMIEAQAIMEKNQGKYSAAVARYKAALALSPDDPFRLQNIYGNLGIAYKHLRDFATAKEYLSQQEFICRLNCFIGHLANSLINQANVLQEGHEDFSGCIVKTREALSLFVQLGDYRGYAIALGNAGNAHAHLGEYEQALELFDSQEKVGRNLNLPKNVAFALRGRSLIAARYEKNPIKSKILLAEANELFRSTGAHHLIVDE